MPNDLYHWESQGSLMHHCPQCFKPLTTPQARSRCLGDHVEWCKNYHTQLFKKGTSSQCEPCRRGDEEHEKRHREIAELLHELKQIKQEQAPGTPLTPKALNTLPHPLTPGQDSPTTPMTKKERKAAKKAKKVAEMPKVVSSADIEFVASVLHPEEPTADDDDFEKQLLEDPDIKLNRFFHKGTSNQRDIRNEFVVKDRKGSKVELKVEDEKMEKLMQFLNVSPLPAKATGEEKTIRAKLTDRIEKDLVQMQHEAEQLIMRKAGFWRWASKKAYDSIVQNGRLWDQKDADGVANKSNGDTNSSSSSVVAGGEEAEIDGTEPDPGMLAPSEEAEVTTPKQMGTEQGPRKDSATDFPVPSSSPIDDGWTTVGKGKGKETYAKKVQKPMGKIKLSSNGGLKKLATIPMTKKRRGYADMFLDEETNS